MSAGQEVPVHVERTHRLTVRVEAAEIPERVLRDLLDECPTGATISVRVVESGQRDPIVIGYVFTVDLEAAKR